MRVFVDHSTAGEVEHEVGEDRTRAMPPAIWRGDVGGEVAAVEPAEDGVGEAHDRVEVGAGHRPEREDERDETGGGRGRVLEQLEPDVARREAFRGDARADHDRDEHRRADELGNERGERESRVASATTGCGARRRGPEDGEALGDDPPHHPAPAFSPVSNPASASALVWWLIVGCDLPNGSRGRTSRPPRRPRQARAAAAAPGRRGRRRPSRALRPRPRRSARPSSGAQQSAIEPNDRESLATATKSPPTY